MKDIVRLKTSLSEEIERLLNDQIKKEAKSSFNYLAMSSWCERNGFLHSANFFKVQSSEEREHMMKIFEYINKVGGTAVTPEVTNVEQEFEGLRTVFESALEQEIAITHSINDIYDKAVKAKDYTTANFLNWFLQEQIEEEALARRCMEIFDIVNEQEMGLLVVDREISHVRKQVGE